MVAIPSLIPHPMVGAEGLVSPILPILFLGIGSSGIAYTLQIVAQKSADPTSATLIMSLESVFAVLSGWIVLGEKLSLKELSGCLLEFVAVLLAQVQLPIRKKKKD